MLNIITDRVSININYQQFKKVHASTKQRIGFSTQDGRMRYLSLIL